MLRKQIAHYLGWRIKHIPSNEVLLRVFVSCAHYASFC